MKTKPLPLADLYRAENMRRVRPALAALAFYKLPGSGYCALLPGGAGYATVYDYDDGGTWIDTPPADVDRARMLQRPTLACPQLSQRVMRDALDYVNRTAKTVAVLAGDESRAEEIAGEIVAVLDAAEAWSLAVAEDDTLADGFYRTRYTGADGFNARRNALDWNVSEALDRAVISLPPTPGVWARAKREARLALSYAVGRGTGSTNQALAVAHFAYDAAYDALRVSGGTPSRSFAVVLRCASICYAAAGDAFRARRCRLESAAAFRTATA